MLDVRDIVVLSAFGAVLIVVIVLTVRIWSLERKLKIFFQGKEAKSLEEIMILLRNETADGSQAIGALETHLKSVEGRLQRSLQKVGMVRFNPFKEAGGDQSFSVALLDEARNGVVISSLYSRDGVRVYGKPIKAGNSTYRLSEEEQEAISQALGSANPKSEARNSKQ